MHCLCINLINQSQRQTSYLGYLGFDDYSLRRSKICQSPYLLTSDWLIKCTELVISTHALCEKTRMIIMNGQACPNPVFSLTTVHCSTSSTFDVCFVFRRFVLQEEFYMISFKRIFESFCCIWFFWWKWCQMIILFSLSGSQINWGMNEKYNSWRCFGS